MKKPIDAAKDGNSKNCPVQIISELYKLEIVDGKYDSTDDKRYVLMKMTRIEDILAKHAAPGEETSYLANLVVALASTTHALGSGLDDPCYKCNIDIEDCEHKAHAECIKATILASERCGL